MVQYKPIQSHPPKQELVGQSDDQTGREAANSPTRIYKPLLEVGKVHQKCQQNLHAKAVCVQEDCLKFVTICVC